MPSRHDPRLHVPVPALDSASSSSRSTSDRGEYRRERTPSTPEGAQYSSDPALISFTYEPQEEQFNGAPYISQEQGKEFGSNGIEDPRFFQSYYDLEFLSAGLVQGGHDPQATTPAGPGLVTPPSYPDFVFNDLPDVNDPPFPASLVARGNALVQQGPASQICVEPCQYDQHVCLNCGRDPDLIDINLHELNMPSSPEAGSPMDLENNNHRADKIQIAAIPRPKADNAKPAAQFQCEWCEKDFRRQGDRDRHKQTACIYRPHNVPTFKHRCQVSDCRFSHLRKDKLLLHIQRAHASKA